MNLKYIFVKDFKEYFKFPNRIFDLEIVQKNLKLRSAVELALSGNKEAVYFLYRELVKMQHAKTVPNLKSVYESKIFGDTGLKGLKIDFNFGLRLDIPKGNFHVKISDAETGTIFFDEDISDARLVSSENYFINWQIEIFLDGEKVFEHFFDLKNKNVLLVLNSTALGDTITQFPYIREFQKKYNCKIKIFVANHMSELVKHFFPDIEQVKKITQKYYATFYVELFMGDILTLPDDCRTIELEKTAEFFFNLNNTPPPLKFFPTAERKISEKYVCIAVQASGIGKIWLYPNGWEIVCDYLKKLGYRVLCIDKNEVEFDEKRNIKNQKPKNAENFCGNIPLIERANMLYYADFFIGASSGLAWLAKLADCPVVMISGLTMDYYEFPTPYRIANRFVCNGCFNDQSVPYFGEKFCPYNAGTDRELECSKKISPHQVIQAIDNLIADKKLKK